MFTLVFKLILYSICAIGANSAIRLQTDKEGLLGWLGIVAIVIATIILSSRQIYLCREYFQWGVLQTLVATLTITAFNFLGGNLMFILFIKNRRF